MSNLLLMRARAIWTGSREKQKLWQKKRSGLQVKMPVCVRKLMMRLNVSRFPIAFLASCSLSTVIARLQQIQLVANDIQTMSKELATVYEVSLDPFEPLFHKLVDQFPQEFDRYRLDEIVVAAVAPLVRRMVAQWNPLEDPTAFILTFRGWRRALKVNSSDEKHPQTQVDIYGSQTVAVSANMYVILLILLCAILILISAKNP